MVGGPIFPYYQTQKPKWFKDKYEIRSQGVKLKTLDSDQYLSASNLAVRKDVFRKVGGFDTSLGVSGNKHGFGEEVKLQRLIRQKFGADQVGYDPRITVKHLVPGNKMNIIYFIQSRFGAGRYHEKIYEDNIGIIKAGLKALRSVAVIIWKTVKLPMVQVEEYGYWQNYLVEEVIPNFYEIGWFWQKLV
ncbi:MAG: Glycosyl transferase family 2 [uncultured bacterium]|nr:MAG: Glycosyl transferase family 2 [uncultured bacterium]